MDLVDGIQNKMCEKEGRRFQFCGMWPISSFRKFHFCIHLHQVVLMAQRTSCKMSDDNLSEFYLWVQIQNSRKRALVKIISLIAILFNLKLRRGTIAGIRQAGINNRVSISPFLKVYSIRSQQQIT
jgi:hypothetical protein